MKWVLLSLVLITLATFVGAWILIDLPTAALALAAWLAVCGCAAAPVIFSVVTRRNDLRRLERENAEEIR